MIRKELVFVNQDFKNREELFDFLIEKINELGLIDDKKEYLDAILKREEEFSTAIGYDLALPHGQTDTVHEPFVAFCRLNNPIEWSNENKNLVKMVFLLGVRETHGADAHLRILATLSRNLMHEEFRNQILKAKNADEVYVILSQIGGNE